MPKQKELQSYAPNRISKSEYESCCFSLMMADKANKEGKTLNETQEYFTSLWRKTKEEYENQTPIYDMCENFPLMVKCQEKAQQMPHFTLLACDDLALGCISNWIGKASQSDIPENKLNEAIALRNEMLQWRLDNPEQCKLPD